MPSVMFHMNFGMPRPLRVRVGGASNRDMLMDLARLSASVEHPMFGQLHQFILDPTLTRRVTFPSSFYRSPSARDLPSHLQRILNGDEGASYEDLLRLSEIVQPVSRGASQATIDALPTRTYHAPDTSPPAAPPATSPAAPLASSPGKQSKSEQQQDKCSICLSAYEEGDELTTLPLCLHTFHKGCIDHWLGINKVCPVCRSPCSQ
eukprot:TRINITY_DN4999_c0_g1_i1.p1 TRINITY_DN4999_c0_g1~~TRINITY_DN4999_c0_g1_i1.p1  ORF type:complete len:206 (-),score=47.54 TRINITY_DN4999_c0_g1_i1:61-678(-)